MENYFFDFDGTLADSGDAAAIAIQKSFKKEGYPVPNRDEIDYYMGIPIEISFPKMAHVDMTEDQLQQLMSVFRLDYRQIEEKYLCLFDGIKNVLQQLTNCQKKLFVVSSKHSNALLRNLDQLGITEYFTSIIGSDNVSHFKPHPEGILLLMKKYQLDPTQSVMIGDAIFDIQMGKSAYVHTAAVCWGAHKSEELAKENPDYLLTQPNEILSIK